MYIFLYKYLFKEITSQITHNKVIALILLTKFNEGGEILMKRQLLHNNLFLQKQIFVNIVLVLTVSLLLFDLDCINLV